MTKACAHLQTLTSGRALAFVIGMAAGGLILYAILLAFSALVFWSPGLTVLFRTGLRRYASASS